MLTQTPPHPTPPTRRAQSYAHYAKELHASKTRHEFDRVLRGLQGPGPGPGPDNSNGSSPSSECDTTDGDTCDNDGSTNYCDTSKLSYDMSTGKFSGSVVTNECNDQLRQYKSASASCEEQTIPSPSATNPGATPVLGRIAMTLSGGVNIYSAFEAGFNDCSTDGMPCACSGASCPGGMDVRTCEAHLDHSCTTTVDYEMFMDSCGGHAIPYHIHVDPVCNYISSDSGHSTLVGVSLDGYGIYGKFETANQRPCDLDVCHGHVGSVPVQEEVSQGGVVFGGETVWAGGAYRSADTAICGASDGAGGATWPSRGEVQIWAHTASPNRVRL